MTEDGFCDCGCSLDEPLKVALGERDAYRELSLALDSLLAHYRVGSRPPEKLLDRIQRARRAVL